MTLNFPGFAGPRPDRKRHQAHLAERAILGGATAKRPIRRPISLKHPIRQVDKTPIRCIQNTGFTMQTVDRSPPAPFLDRLAQRVLGWFLRGLAAVFAFILLTAAPGWIEAAFAAQHTPWGF